MYFSDLVKKNGDMLWNLSLPLPEEYQGFKYKRPFDYSIRNGGTVDSFKYYNDYIVLIGAETKGGK